MRNSENIGHIVLGTVRQLMLNNLFISFLNLFISLIELKKIQKHPLKEHRCKFKIHYTTYSNRSLEQRMTIVKIGFYCIIKIFGYVQFLKNTKFVRTVLNHFY